MSIPAATTTIAGIAAPTLDAKQFAPEARVLDGVAADPEADEAAAAF
jgi:hypothetical protein